MGYSLLDSGNYRKLEKFGSLTFLRPCLHAIWDEKKYFPMEDFADAIFLRKGEKGDWFFPKKNIPETWEMVIEDFTFVLRMNSYGHVGFFPEHMNFWPLIKERILKKDRKFKFLNLFGYTGAASLIAASLKADVVHVDSSKSVISWAIKNFEKNNLKKDSATWVIEDALKFIKREERRQKNYHGIILDPPTFGRGPKGEIFKIEDSLKDLLEISCKIVNKNDGFILLTCHTPGFTPCLLGELLRCCLEKGNKHQGYIEKGELFLEGDVNLPSGSFALWKSL